MLGKVFSGGSTGRSVLKALKSHLNTVLFKAEHMHEFSWVFLDPRSRKSQRQRILERATAIIESDAPVVALRQWLSRVINEQAKYGSMLLPPDHLSEEFGVYAGISGEISKVLDNQAVAETLADDPDSDVNDPAFESFADKQKILEMHYCRANFYLDCADLVRRGLGDCREPLIDDWLLPYRRSMYAWWEHHHRVEMSNMLTLLSDEAANVELIFDSCVKAGDRWPDEEFNRAKQQLLHNRR